MWRLAGLAALVCVPTAMAAQAPSRQVQARLTASVAPAIRVAAVSTGPRFRVLDVRSNVPWMALADDAAATGVVVVGRPGRGCPRRTADGARVLACGEPGVTTVRVAVAPAPPTSALADQGGGVVADHDLEVDAPVPGVILLPVAEADRILLAAAAHR